MQERQQNRMIDMIDALKGLVSFESISKHESEDYPFGRQTEAALEYCLSIADDFGFRTVRGDKYAYAEIGEGEDLICILTHLDVVPAGDGWTHKPFEVELTEDRIYGRGTIDDKGPTIAVLFAMKDVLDSCKLTKRVRVIFGQSEENGDWIDIKNYKKHEELPVCGFTPDGDFPAIFCEKGSLVLRVCMPLSESGIEYAAGGIAANMVPDRAVVMINGHKYEGSGSAFHGCAPWLGSNAISDAFEKAASDLSQEDRLSNFVKMYNTLISRDVFAERLGLACDDELSGRLTINAGKIDVEKDEVVLMLDLRYPAIIDSESIISTINERFGDFGASVECVYQTPPVYMDPDSPLISSLLDAYREITGDMSAPISIGGSTYAKAMDNIVAFGPNFPGHENREHRQDEYILKDDFFKLRDIYAKALQKLLNISFE